MNRGKDELKGPATRQEKEHTWTVEQFLDPDVCVWLGLMLIIRLVLCLLETLGISSSELSSRAASLWGWWGWYDVLQFWR